MPNSNPTLIVSIPGTQDTQEFTRTAALAAIQRGEISQDQWIWSPEQNEWKQVREFPELQSGIMVLPKSAQQPAAAQTPQEHVAVAAVKIPQAAVAAQPVAAQPAVAKAVVKTKMKAQAAPTQSQQLAGARYSRPMEVKHEFPIFKVILGIAFLSLGGIIGANYLLINEPLQTSMAGTSYRNVQVYGHLGAFVQPGALIVHVVPTKSLTTDNFADFLVALAKSTPPQPINGKGFANIGLTTAWQSQYAIDGDSWAQLARMTNSSAEEKMQFEVEHLLLIDGTPLAIKHAGESSDKLEKAEAEAWKALVAHFQGQ